MNMISILQYLRAFFKFLNNKKSPTANKLQRRISSCTLRIIEQEEALLRMRFLYKKIKNKKFNILFVCYRPSLWKSLQSIYEAFATDDNFHVTVIATRYRDVGSFVDQGAYPFFKSLSYNVVEAYDELTDAWRDLRDFEPDFVFYQTPYDKRYPDAYKSKKVSQYAVIGYVHYAIRGQTRSPTYNLKFARNCTLNFVDTESRRDIVQHFVQGIDDPRIRQICFTGHPKLDHFPGGQIQGAVPWKNPDEREQFRILWTPRWTEKEGTCFFRQYKDSLPAYAASRQNVSLTFRPHPIAFLRYVRNGLLTEEQLQQYIDLYARSDRACLDTTEDYLPVFASSSVLVADYTSLMAEYVFTGKPVIYCHRVDQFTEEFRRLAQGFYWVHDWAELEKTLDMLRGGQDPLAEKRRALAADMFHRPPGGAGRLIKELVKRFLMGDWDPRLGNGERLFASTIPTTAANAKDLSK